MFLKLAKPVLSAGALLTALLLPGCIMATTTTIPNSALTASTSLYTNSYGNIVVMTDGGNSPGIGDPSGRNDDGFSGPVNLGFTLNFFGNNYNQFFINNNGNVSFGNGISEFTPTGPTGASQPVISPFFADVDTQGTNSGVVRFAQSTNQVVVTWDHVGYFDANSDKLDTFQLILRGPNYAVPAGEGQIGFFYTGMQWETGDASGGNGGFGGTPAAVGFGDGLGNGQVLQGSTQNGISGIVNNEHIWFNLSSAGVPTTPVPTTPTPVPPTVTPEPASMSMMAMGILGTGLLAWKRRKTVQ